MQKEYTEWEDDEYELTDEQIQELDNIREMRLSAESKGYNWDEAKKFITVKKNWRSYNLIIQTRQLSACMQLLNKYGEYKNRIRFELLKKIEIYFKKINYWEKTSISFSKN